MSSRPLTGLARFLEVLATLALIGLPLATGLALVLGDAPARYLDAYPGMTAVPPQGAALAGLIALDLAALALTLTVLWQVRGLFRLYLDGAEVSPTAARRLHLTGVLLIAQAGLAVIGQTADVLILTWANPPGDRVFVVDLADADLALVLGGGLLLLIGRAMTQAAAALDENRGFV